MLPSFLRSALVESAGIFMVRLVYYVFQS
jgi:hypothetical protein